MNKGPAHPRSDERRKAWNRAKGAGRLLLVHVVGWAVIVLSVLPITLIFPMAFSAAPFLEFPPRALSLRWFTNYFSRPDWIAPTLVSIRVAVLTMVIATILGTLASIALIRGRFKGEKILLAFFISPMIVPTIVVAIALYFWFARLHLLGSSIALVLGHVILAVPLVIVTVTAALRTVDDTLERAAMSLGAGPIRAFCRVTLPLIRPGVLTGAFFAFLASFDDVVIAIFISGTRAKTLPKRMWEGIRYEVDPTIAAVSTLIIMLALAFLLISEIARLHAQRIRGSVEEEE